MRTFILSLLVIATAVPTIATALFFGHGLSTHHAGPFIWAAGALAVALLFGTLTLWWGKRVNDAPHGHGAPHVH